MTQNQTQQKPTLKPNGPPPQEEQPPTIIEKKFNELIQSLPKAPNYIMGPNKELVNYHNFWFPIDYFKNCLWFQSHFMARDTDLIIASLPKCGTTWLKSLLFTTVNRINHPINQSHPLISHHPHDLVYHLEDGVYSNYPNLPRPGEVTKLPSPRLFNTHIPCTTLPESIKTSGCRILFISRNPLDTCVSQWHFYQKIGKKISGHEFKSYSIHDYFEDSVDGKIMYGPFFEHVVEYWKLSLERPDKVLFLKYEDVKEDPTRELKRVAEFVGMPFSCEEESGGVIEDIIKLCSINNLKGLDVNKEGVDYRNLDRKDYFRKGEVGDWNNYFTPPMVERMCNLMHQKLGGSGLTFKVLLDHEVGERLHIKLDE